jgi:membrane protease YdiL (CAAX protease family)
MNDKPRLFDLNNQPPVIQLFASVLIMIPMGMLLFYFFVLAGSLIFRTDVPGMLSIPAADAGLREESILKYIQASQQIGLFFIPAVVIALLLRKGNESFVRTDKVPGSVPVLMVILLAFLIVPITGFTGILNSKMNLPDWLSGVEGWIRTKEDTASELTGLLIKSSGTGELIINIFIFALIPSIAEEMIFRGILQQLLCRLLRSDHIGIWITALLFSAIHFQFFGFLPRLILGLSFGYLFFWSGNLWLPVIAHFINNCIPVLMSHFVGWSEFTDKASDLVESQIMILMAAAILCFGVFFYFWSEHRKGLFENR